MKFIGFVISLCFFVAVPTLARPPVLRLTPDWGQQPTPPDPVKEATPFPRLRWEKEVRWERTAMKERQTRVKVAG